MSKGDWMDYIAGGAFGVFLVLAYKRLPENIKKDFTNKLNRQYQNRLSDQNRAS